MHQMSLKLNPQKIRVFPKFQKKTLKFKLQILLPITKLPYGNYEITKLRNYGGNVAALRKRIR